MTTANTIYSKTLNCDIDLDALEAAVRDLAAAYPDAIYVGIDDSHGSKCYYTRGDVDHGPATEGCIIGHALVRIGIDPQTVRKLDTDMLPIAHILGTRLGRSPWFTVVQNRQDDKHTWQYAIKAADANSGQ